MNTKTLMEKICTISTKITELDNYLKENNNENSVTEYSIPEYIQDDMKLNLMKLEIEEELEILNSFFSRMNGVMERYELLKSYYIHKFLKEETNDDQSFTEEEIEALNNMESDDKNIDLINDPSEIPEKEIDLESLSEEELQNVYGYNKTK